MVSESVSTALSIIRPLTLQGPETEIDEDGNDLKEPDFQSALTYSYRVSLLQLFAAS